MYEKLVIYQIFIFPSYSIHFILFTHCLLYSHANRFLQSKVLNSFCICSYHYKHMNLAGSFRVDHSNSNYKRTHCVPFPSPPF